MASSPSERPEEGEDFADATRQLDENALMGPNADKRRRGKASIVYLHKGPDVPIDCCGPTNSVPYTVSTHLYPHHAARCTKKFSAPKFRPSFGIIPQGTRAELTLEAMVNVALATRLFPSTLGDLRTRTKPFWLPLHIFTHLTLESS